MELPPVNQKDSSKVPLSCASCLALVLFFNAFLAFAAAQNHHDILPPTIMQLNVKSKLFGLGAPRGLTWLCYYGSNRDVLALPEYNLLILEADALGAITREDKGNRVCVAYMSIGEVSKNRWFWPLVQDKPWLLDENSDWPDARRIDPRSKEWSDLLVNTIAPKLLAAGYDGFMLDNVDIGEYLESRDHAAYAGAKEAVVNTIKRLRKTFPKAVLIANGALETAVDTADCLDAVIRESIFSRWIANEDGSFTYAEVSPQDQAWLRPRLLRIRGAGIPVLALEYVDSEDDAARQRVCTAAQKAGYYPYIAERQLMRFPSVKSRDSDLIAKE